MFDGFHSGMSYSAVGHKFNVNESKIPRKEETCWWNHFATSTTCYEAKKMTEMGLNLWIHGLAISFLKSVVEVLFPAF